MPSTSAGVIYPVSGDHTRLWEHFENMANSMTPRLKPVFADNTARDTAFPAPAFGDEAAVASTGEWYWHNGTAWVSKQPRMAYKTVAETVSASATLQNDDHLFFSVEANSRYVIDGMLWVSLGGITPDIKVSQSGPTGSTLTWNLIGPDAGTGDIDFGAYDAVSGTVTTNVKNRPTSSGGAFGYRLEANVVTGGTAGTWRLTWAQVTATASTALSANSLLKCWKYA